MDAILDQSVCSIINSLKNELYYITYKDNYPTTSSTTSSTTISSSASLEYLGCEMTELLDYQEMVSIRLTELGAGTGISPELCQSICSSLPGLTG